ncbi:MAG: CoA transferase [Chloroflexi bacterium]|nr:CoA transferase [Chloroflexota bacterium]
MTQGLLPGVRVLEVGEGVSAPYCAKILGQMGAQVIKVEPPEGDVARRIGPFPDDVPHPEQSALFLALNTNKQGITLDLTTQEDAKRFRALAETADVVVDNLPSGRMDALGLGYDALRADNQGLILTSITPFGRWGPYEGYKATDLILFHMSGHAHGLLGPVEDTDADPPIRAGGYQSELVAGLAAATATLTALFQKRMTGRGRRIDVSSYEAMATQLISGLAGSAYGRPSPSRDLKESREGTVSAIVGVLTCKDGYVSISPREDAQWERWLELMGSPDWASDERFATREARESNAAPLWELLNKWSRQHSKHDIARWGQERRIPCFPVNTMPDLFDDAHLASRDFFVEMTHPVAGTLKYPGVAYRLSNSPLPLDARPAPLLGEHNDLIGTGIWT